MCGPEVRARGNAISGSRNFLSLTLEEKDYDLLLAAKNEGIKRGVRLLAGMDIDLFSLGISSANSFAPLLPGIDHHISPSNVTQRLSSPVADVGYGSLSEFLKWAFEKVTEKFIQNPTVKRLVQVAGVSVNVILIEVRELILDKLTLKALIPFYGAVKGLIDTGVNIYKAASASNAFDRLDKAAAMISSGVPRQMFNQFRDFLSNEIILNATKTGYTFGKTVASVLVTVFAAPASSPLAFVNSVIEAISSIALKLYQAFTFRRATQRCAQWVEANDISADLDFAEGIAACPFIGCVFFGAANFMGHFNLSAMLTDTKFLTSANLTLAVSEVSAVQKIACKYVASSEIPFKFKDEERYGWILKMMNGMADDAPRSEFVTDDASWGAKFVHWGKKLFRPAKAGGKKLYEFLP